MSGRFLPSISQLLPTESNCKLCAISSHGQSTIPRDRLKSKVDVNHPHDWTHKQRTVQVQTVVILIGIIQVGILGTLRARSCLILKVEWVIWNAHRKRSSWSQFHGVLFMLTSLAHPGNSPCVALIGLPAGFANLHCACYVDPLEVSALTPFKRVYKL